MSVCRDDIALNQPLSVKVRPNQYEPIAEFNGDLTPTSGGMARPGSRFGV